jgi:hypothetical protein
MFPTNWQQKFSFPGLERTFPTKLAETSADECCDRQRPRAV